MVTEPGEEPKNNRNIHSSYQSAIGSQTNIPRKEENMMGRFRPQIALGIICATLFSCLGLWIGLQLEAVEIITAIIGGLFGFLGGVSLKVLENE
jgi:hypothetical protein|tara:strand:- start:268 stop:549 length:282 start_codon:yes stop_codon:yes gene_type:complete